MILTGSERKKSVPRKGKSPTRKVIDWLHRWLGIVSGIVVLIICVTGCLFVFQEEISNVVYSKERFITPSANAPLPLSVLQQKAQAALGAGIPINYAEIDYKDPKRTWEFVAYAFNNDAVTYSAYVKYYRSVFIDPYNGAVVGVMDHKWEFFNVVKNLHWSLLLNTPYGQPIVGWSTFIFVILLITGMIMWWPKKWNKKTREDSFSIRWKAKLKRINYDLHNVLGFYSVLVSLIIAFTGMVWAFTWFQAIVYVAASGTTTPPAPAPALKSVMVANAPAAAPDVAFQTAIQQVPDARRFSVSPAKGKEGLIYISGYRGKETYYDRDDLEFDQYSGKLLYRNDFATHNRGEKLVSMNYDIHVGAIAGLPGKIIAFTACLICTSLPITGFIIWWGKRKKKPAQKNKRKELLKHNHAV